LIRAHPWLNLRTFFSLADFHLGADLITPRQSAKTSSIADSLSRPDGWREAKSVRNDCEIQPVPRVQRVAGW
jgi:hypothetical protein